MTLGTTRGILYTAPPTRDVFADTESTDDLTARRTTATAAAPADD